MADPNASYDAGRAGMRSSSEANEPPLRGQFEDTDTVSWTKEPDGTMKAHSATAQPYATSIPGQILISDGTQFVPGLPVISDAGFIAISDAGLIVVT